MVTSEQSFKLLITKRDAAAALSVSVRTIENFIRRKELVARKIGRRTLIPLASLESFARRDHLSPRATQGPQQSTDGKSMLAETRVPAREDRHAHD